MASLDHSHSHSHDALGGHGHTHEILDGPGSFLNREQPLSLHEGRDWKDRAYTIGIGGLVFCLSLLNKNKNKSWSVLLQSSRVWENSVDVEIVLGAEGWV